MTVRPIRLLGDPVLRTPAEPVTSFDAELRALVTDLIDTLVGEPGRAGVAAPQIGVSARVFAYGVEDAIGHVVNPTIDVSAEQVDDEGAWLSLPGRPRLRPVRRAADRRGDRLPGASAAARDRPPRRPALRRHALRRRPPPGAARDPVGVS